MKFYKFIILAWFILLVAHMILGGQGTAGANTAGIHLSIWLAAAWIKGMK